MNHLLPVRHGENKANLSKKFSHRLVDYPLTAKGRLQAEQTAAYLRGYPVTQVFTLPLKQGYRKVRNDLRNQSFIDASSRY